MQAKGKSSKIEKGEQFFLKQINEKADPNVKCDPTKPDNTFQIEHVYGFSGDRYKNGLHFGKDNNEIIFTSAGLGIV